MESGKQSLGFIERNQERALFPKLLFNPDRLSSLFSRFKLVIIKTAVISITGIVPRIWVHHLQELERDRMFPVLLGTRSITERFLVLTINTVGPR